MLTTNMIATTPRNEPKNKFHDTSFFPDTISGKMIQNIKILVIMVKTQNIRKKWICKDITYRKFSITLQIKCTDCTIIFNKEKPPFGFKFFWEKSLRTEMFMNSSLFHSSLFKRDIDIKKIWKALVRYCPILFSFFQREEENILTMVMKVDHCLDTFFINNEVCYCSSRLVINILPYCFWLNTAAFYLLCFLEWGHSLNCLKVNLQLIFWHVCN